VEGAGGKVLASVEVIPATHHTRTMVDGLWGRFRMLLKWMADIVDERGLGHLGERQVPRFEPASEVEQVKGVSTERVE